MGWLDVYHWRQLDALLVDCQADLLASLPTRFVLPLLRDAPDYALARLNPVVTFDGGTYRLVPQLAMTRKSSELGEPVGTVIAEEYVILRAIDCLVTGV